MKIAFKPTNTPQWATESARTAQAISMLFRERPFRLQPGGYLHKIVCIGRFPSGKGMYRLDRNFYEPFWEMPEVFESEGSLFCFGEEGGEKTYVDTVYFEPTESERQARIDKFNVFAKLIQYVGSSRDEIEQIIRPLIGFCISHTKTQEGYYKYYFENNDSVYIEGEPDDDYYARLPSVCRSDEDGQWHSPNDLFLDLLDEFLWQA